MKQPFLRMKFRMMERAKIHDAYYSARSIKEIITKKEECYKALLREERLDRRNNEKIPELEGFIKCLDWLTSED